MTAVAEQFWFVFKTVLPLLLVLIILELVFGLVALVALAPIVSILFFGMLYQMKYCKGGR